MKFHIEAGGEFETVTPRELATYMDGRQQAERDRMRGVKFRKIPPMNAVVTAASLIQIGGDFPFNQAGNQVASQVGPSAGHAWVLRLISVNGLTASATPDTVGMQFLGGAEPDFNWWAFNGNTFYYAWGKNELWLDPSNYLQFQNIGAIAAAVGSRIRVRGFVQQVPAELMAELV